MTNSQLYFTIAIPACFFALNFLAIMWQARGLEKRMDAKFDALDAKFDGVNGRIDALRDVMNAKFEAAHQGLLRVEGVLGWRLKHLEER